MAQLDYPVQVRGRASTTTYVSCPKNTRLYRMCDAEYSGPCVDVVGR